MDVDVVDKKFNPLLERDEVEFKVSHEGEPTPSLTDIRKILRAKLNSKADLTVVDSVYSHFGLSTSSGFAKVYKSKEMLEKIEAKHVLNKNFGKEDKKEGGEAPEEKSEEK
jgi:small subunit ribosomal protein S24e